MKKPLSVLISGKEVLPLVEGGKGISVSNGLSAGRWALAGGVGTFSGVNADFYDAHNQVVPLEYKGKTRQQRHEELVSYGIRGAIAQAEIAHAEAQGNGCIHMNVLWEMGGVEQIVEGMLKKAHHLIDGITCGAGMPYRLAEIASSFGVFYLPIVSSARAFRALWKRSYHRFGEWLSAVVYEDPWKAGGHNGLSNQEDPRIPQDPYPRVAALRSMMIECGLADKPIIMAGGVWRLSEWENWIDNPEIGPIAFQFGTRPLLTQESPLSPAWKDRLRSIKKGDVVLNTFSPTGFYSSAVRNHFLEMLQNRSKRQVPYTEHAEEDTFTLSFGQRGRILNIFQRDKKCVEEWIASGYTVPIKTPDNTVIFTTPDEADQIHEDQVHCMGCLSACKFSNWDQKKGSTGQKPDPRSFCIQKSLQDIAHGGSVEENLMFAGHNVYRFADDPFYANGFIPTVGQLVERIMTGE